MMYILTKKGILWILLAYVLIVQCTNGDTVVEPAPTEMEVVVQKLMQILKEEGEPELAAAYVYDTQTGGWVNDSGGACSGWKLDYPFIRICGNYYNLAKLVKFEHSGYLCLYFQN